MQGVGVRCCKIINEILPLLIEELSEMLLRHLVRYCAILCI